MQSGETKRQLLFAFLQFFESSSEVVEVDVVSAGRLGTRSGGHAHRRHGR